MKRQTPESAVLAEVLQCLAHHRILCFRMNTGAHVATDARGKSRLIRYGVKGMADVLAFPRGTAFSGETNNPLWIECKAKGGKQSPDQSIFQQVVEADGHWYLVAHSYEDVEAFLKEKGIR